MAMELKSDRNETKVVFLELPMAMYGELEKLHQQVGGRGVATVIRRIVETALKEGITVKKEKATKNGG